VGRRHRPADRPGHGDDPGLTRSSVHRCLQRHGISRLPEVEGDKPDKREFKTYPIGYFHIDIAEVRSEAGKLYLFVAIDRTSKFAFAELHEKADRSSAASRKSSICLRSASSLLLCLFCGLWRRNILDGDVIEVITTACPQVSVFRRYTTLACLDQ
jgi:hypothetical protein